MSSAHPNPAVVSTSPELDARPRVSLPVLSSAERRSFQSCKRKHYIRHRLLRRSLQGAEHVAFTRALERGLGAWWRAAARGDDRLAAARTEIADENFGDDTGSRLDPFDRAKADAMLAAYHARWNDAVVEVLAVDAEFTAPIANPQTGRVSRTYVLGGTIDAIARMDDGLVYVIERRTTSESIDAESEYRQRLRLDAQHSDLVVGARALGFEVAGCCHDVVAKPRLTPLEATLPEKRQYTKKDGRLYVGQRETDEAPYEYGARIESHVAENLERYYARVVIGRSPEEERDAAQDTWNTARDIREADLALRHPRNPDACKGWGQLCEFFAVCTREADVNDGRLFRGAGGA